MTDREKIPFRVFLHKNIGKNEIGEFRRISGGKYTKRFIDEAQAVEAIRELMLPTEHYRQHENIGHAIAGISAVPIEVQKHNKALQAVIDILEGR